MGLEGLTVLSVEQALALPFLTFRLAQEGMRVIRLESPRHPDPNRAIGDDVLGEPGMGSYFLPVNAGKQAITLDLQAEEGRAILHRLVARLPVDVFCVNTLPRNYAKLGIDYETLRRARPELIWLGITGFGPESDEGAYDPVLQARLGWMDLTGEPAGQPQVFGLPMVDLGTSEHAYGAVMRALYLRAATGEGSRIDVAMSRSALSWMAIPVAMAASFGKVMRRRGTTHPFFGPVAVYEARDGHVYVAVGNDRQWEKLAALAGFEALAGAAYRTNAGRMAEGDALHREMRAIVGARTVDAVLAAMRAARVPAARVATLADVLGDPCLEGGIRTRDPRTGRDIYLPAPPCPSAWLRARGMSMSFPPRLGEHTGGVLGEALGLGAAEVAALREREVV